MNKGYFLVFLTAVISGFAVFVNKFGVSIINPYVFAWLKNLTVALLLTGMIFAVKDWKALKGLTKKQWLLLIIIGLIGGSIPFLLFFKGLSITTSAQGSFIHKTMFVYAALLAVIFLKEKIDKRFIIGGLFLILGSFFMLKKLSFSINQGDLLILLATLFWSAENVISKYTLKDLEGRTVAWARMSFGAFFISLFLLGTGQASSLPAVNLAQIQWVLITAVFLFCYVMTWYSGLKYIPVHQAMAILFLGSPITTLLSSVFGRGISPQEALSGFLIIMGVIFVIGLKQFLQSIKWMRELIYVRTYPTKF